MATLNCNEYSAAAGPRAQGGFSLWSALYVLLTLGLIALVGFRSVPVYLNDWAVTSALKAVAHDPSLVHASRMDIQRSLEKRFDASYIQGVSARDLEFKSGSDPLILELHYTVRRPLMFNMSLSYHFDDRVSMEQGSVAN